MAHIIISRANLARAIERCKSHHPRVRRAGNMTYAVQRSAGGTATVHFFRDAREQKCAACDCPAGQRPTPMACYHIAAAIALHCALVRQRQSLAPCAPPPAGAGADFCDELDHTPEERERAIKSIERQMSRAVEARNKLRAVTRSLANIGDAGEVEISDVVFWEREVSSAAALLDAAA
jgi:hypothetical protein